MLEISHLYGGWGDTIVNEDIGMTVATGETVAIVGRNGVGKSTLLELLIGRARRREGEITLNGTPLSSLPIQERVRHGLGFVPQSREVFRSLSVDEHLGLTVKPGRWTPATVLELFPSLGARRHNLACHLSGGEQQMLAIGRALVGNPKVLLMDEPSEGLAPIVVERLVAALKEVTADRSVSLLLVEQRIDIAIDMATRCLVMERGRIVREASSAELASAPEKFASLLGLEALVG
jgi:branched-chain amino acid transport system ATP-binding protein